MTEFFKKLTGGGGKNGDAAQQAISALAESTDYMRVEIEGSSFHFYSRPFLRSGTIVVATPQDFKSSLNVGGWLRIRTSETEREELRLQITSVRHGGTGEMATTTEEVTVLCKIPGAVVEPSKRSHDRMRTSQFRDLFLEISSPSSSHPVVDLSHGGLRVAIGEEADLQRFPLGAALNGSGIRLGQKARVTLASIIPRSHHEKGVGLEMVVDSSGNSRKILEMFLDSMAHKEREARSVG